MFDRCRVWRSLLTRQAEGELSPSERALLNEHVDKCAACRKVQAADEALQSVLLSGNGVAILERARTFDDSVVRKLRAAVQLPPGPAWRERVRACSASLSFEFCMQFAGGALAAASITAFVLVSALHPLSSAKSLSVYELKSISALERNEPPVSLESLIQSPTPRAAMLWAPPGRLQRRSTDEHPAVVPRTTRPDTGRSNPAPRRHGQRFSGFAMG